MSRQLEQVNVRLPDGFRAQIQAEAEKNSRSMNAEFVYRLEQSLGREPEVIEQRYETLQAIRKQRVRPEASLRDEFAKAAMVALIEAHWSFPDNSIAHMAYQTADQMMKAREA